jgi:hypothetical protein
MLLESKLYNPDGPWALIVGPIEKLLTAAWQKGDYYDRFKVMKFCGLGDPSVILRRVEYSIMSGVPQLQEAALDASRFLGKPPARLARWVRKQVATRIATSKKRFEMLRWEAVAMDLPNDFEMSIPLERSRYIYKFNYLINVTRLVENAMDRVLGSIDFRSGSARRGRFISEILFFNINVLQFSIMFAILGATLLFGVGGYTAKVLGILFIYLSFRTVCVFAKLSCLSFPGKLGIHSTIRCWNNSIRELPPLFSALGVAFIALLAPGVIFFWCCRILDILGYLPEYSLIAIGSAGVVLIGSPIFSIASKVSHRKANNNCKELISRSISFGQAISLARSGLEVYMLCVYASNEPRGVLRRLVAIVTASERILRKDPSSELLPWFGDISSNTMHAAVGVLISGIEDLDTKAGS